MVKLSLIMIVSCQLVVSKVQAKQNLTRIKASFTKKQEIREPTLFTKFLAKLIRGFANKINNNHRILRQTDPKARSGRARFGYLV